MPRLSMWVKQKNLKNRVRSYFKSSHEGKTAKLVSEIVDFETIITSTNKEAFLLEITLIQKHQPYFNIKLKRGTGYPYIKITNERDPRLLITGDVKKKMAAFILALIRTCMPPKKHCDSYNGFILYDAVRDIKGGPVCIIIWVNVWARVSKKCLRVSMRPKSRRLNVS